MVWYYTVMNSVWRCPPDIHSFIGIQFKMIRRNMMFRKSVFIVLFVCLLATVSSAFTPSGNYPWDFELTWNTDNTDANWYNPTNWTGGAVAGDPNLNNDVVMMPMVPGPQITSDANAAMLMFNGWDPTSYGAKDANVTLDVNAGLCNFGATIQLNSWSDYDSYLGTPNLASRAILNVYGGTIITPTHTNNQTNLCGLHIGGGASLYSNAYGLLNMYGGEVNVPRLEIRFGDVNLYGGTLMCNADTNFYFEQGRPNKIIMNGGTFKIQGDHGADLTSYINNGHIITTRGTLGTPTYNSTPDADGSTWTTLTSTGNLLTAWNPSPANNATEVHYYHGTDTNSVVLTWNKGGFLDVNGYYININHIVYFGASATSLTPQTSIPDADPNNDPCSWTITGTFAIGTPYYWEVNEFNTVSGVNTPGPVWKFTTQDGKAYNPRPQNGQTYLEEPLSISWTAGDWNGPAHYVFFGTNASNCNGASTSSTDGRYRGTVSSPVYPLSRLAETAPGASWTLTPGTPLYWRIDEVNGSTTWKGNAWGFTPAAYVNIDDFEDYNNPVDMNANWTTGYSVQTQNCDSPVSAVPSGRVSFIYDADGKHMNLYYDISGSKDGAFSEANTPYVGGTPFTSTVFSPQLAALRVDYKGSSLNYVDSSNYNRARMYVAIEDTAGNIGVYTNPDNLAVQATAWTQWYIALKDINSAGLPSPVKLAAVSNFFVGIGPRLNLCDNVCLSGCSNNDGNVMFDNIRLYSSTCNPAYAQAADMDGDCDVDINDLSIFAKDWLAKADYRTFAITAPKAPVIWYKFNETTGTAVTNYGTADPNPSGYTGTVVNWASSSWDPCGRNSNGCVHLHTKQNAYVAIPTGALDFMADANHKQGDNNNVGGITFSIWINGDLSAGEFHTQWDGLISTWNSDSSLETIELHCPSRISSADTAGTMDFVKRYPIEPTGPGGVGTNPLGATSGAYVQYYTSFLDFGGRWNHWVFIKDPNQMQVYCNGNLIGDANGNDWASVANSPLVTLPVGLFHLGCRSSGWGGSWWVGRIQDFRLYDYALSPPEVDWLATDGTGHLLIPITTPANLYLDGGTAGDQNQIVNFEDLSVMGIQWHTIQLWP